MATCHNFECAVTHRKHDTVSDINGDECYSETLRPPITHHINAKHTISPATVTVKRISSNNDKFSDNGAEGDDESTWKVTTGLIAKGMRWVGRVGTGLMAWSVRWFGDEKWVVRRNALLVFASLLAFKYSSLVRKIAVEILRAVIITIILMQKCSWYTLFRLACLFLKRRGSQTNDSTEYVSKD
ncbi:hypothetical protein BDQ17DRAFT_1336155 [Cyathus striatus]|nr:hypothetical protein BDQ17DRAFT_1336155 [Cyathus striatus]